MFANGTSRHYRWRLLTAHKRKWMEIKRVITRPRTVQGYAECWLESEIARFPRIIVSREVREDMLRFQGEQISQPKETMKPYPKIDRLRQSEDGPMFIDILQPIVLLARKSEHPFSKLGPVDQQNAERFGRIAEQLRLRHEEAMDTPRHFEKVRWMARYWNDVIPANAAKFPRVRGVGLDNKATWG